MVLGSFQWREVLLILVIVRHGPAVLAVGARKVCLDMFLLAILSLLSLSLLW